MKIELLTTETQYCPECDGELYTWKRPKHYKPREHQKYFYDRWLNCSGCEYRRPDESTRIYTDLGLNDFLRMPKKKTRKKDFYTPKKNKR